MANPDRLSLLRQVKLTALVDSHWPSPDGEGSSRAGALPGGATLRRETTPATGWALIDDPALGSLGAALAWAWTQKVVDLHVLVADEHAAAIFARQAAEMARVPAVWTVAGRELSPTAAAARPDGPPPDARASLPAQASAFLALFEAHGVDPVVEHDVLIGEVLGLEVARVTNDGEWRLEIGVGAHDREARRDFRPGQDPGDALDEVVAVVRSRRVAGATRHPANTLARERWLRAALVRRPDLVGAAWLEPVAGPLRRRDLRQGAPAGARGEDPGGRPMIVVCSTGVDVSLASTGADMRVLAGAPDADLVFVVPEGDDYPVIRGLAAALRRPARVVTVTRDWPSLVE